MQLREEIGTLRRLLAGRSAWTGLLDELQRHLADAGDAWLESLRLAGSEEPRAVATGNPAPPLRLELSGRLLDRQDPLAKAGRESLLKVQALLDGLRSSPFVAGIEEERFDRSQPGILRFDFILVTGSRQSL